MKTGKGRFIIEKASHNQLPWSCEWGHKFVVKGVNTSRKRAWMIRGRGGSGGRGEGFTCVRTIEGAYR